MSGACWQQRPGFPKATPMIGMAMDGIHPNSRVYSRWADGLSERILKFQLLNTMAP